MSLRLEMKAVASPALLKRGCVNVIGLESIRRQTGARWQKMCDSIRSRLETLLGNTLGPTDFFVPLGETAYLVVMPSCDADDARLCCLKIAFELHKSLLGSCRLQDIVLSRVGGDSMDSLELKPVEDTELADLAKRSGIEALCDGLETISPESPKTVAGLGLESALPTYRFTPIWDAPHEAVIAYRLDTQLAVLSRRGHVTKLHEAWRVELNVLINGFSYATRMLSACLREGGRYLNVTPVPFDLLSAPAGRMELGAACRGLSANLRPFLVFEIVDTPIGVPQSRMTELVCALKPFCRAVTVILPPGGFDSAGTASSGNQGVGLQILALTPPRRTRDDISKLAAMAARLGIASVVSGLRSRDLVDHAREAGVNYLSGPAIGADVSVPLPVSRLSWAELVARDPESDVLTG